MKANRLLALNALFISILASGSSQAVTIAEVGYGVYVSSGTAGNCPSFCTGGAFASASGGGSGFVSASSSESTYATTRGSAAFAPADSYLPLLKAYATAGESKRGSTTSFASQLFSYSGLAPLPVELTVNLTGTVSNNALGNASSNTISASVAVVRGSSLPWIPSFSSLVFEAVNAEDRLALGEASILSPQVSEDTFTLTFDLAPGESFFVISQLTAQSRNGVADAEHTLTMAFDAASKPSLLAVTAVPELGTAWMASAGLAGLGLFARRRRAAAA